MSKASRAFASGAGSPAFVKKARPVLLAKSMTVADGFEAIVAGCIDHLRSNQPLVVQKAMPAALHQVRVALRRLRSSMSLFRTALADDDYPRIREDLRWLAGQLGEARDLDVLLGSGRLTGQHAALEAARAQAYERAIEALLSTRVRSMLLNLMTWAKLGAWRHGPIAKRRLKPYLRRRLTRAWRKAVAARQPSHLSARRRHKLRVLIKTLRYGLDFGAGLYRGSPSRKFRNRLEDLQDNLGWLQDGEAARALLHKGGWEPDGYERREATCLKEADRAFRRIGRSRPDWC